MVQTISARFSALGVAFVLVLALAVSPMLQYARNIYTAAVDLTAQPVVYAQGTNFITAPTEDHVDKQVRWLLDGMYANPDEYEVEYVKYPATLGVLQSAYCGLQCPSGDASVAAGVDANVLLIKQVRDDNPGEVVHVVGLSQGALVGTYTMIRLHGEGYDTTGIEFVMVGNPAQPNGGVVSRFPIKVPIPGIGITFGGPATPSDGAKVTTINNQYDWASDFPAYPLNFVALANTLVGAVGNTHSYPNALDLNDPNVSVTQSGNLTSVFIQNEYGDLPLLRPLKGVLPQKYIDALDTILRPMVEAGYERLDDPAVNVTFRFLPSPEKFVADTRAVAQGFRDGVAQLHTAIKEDVQQGVDRVRDVVNHEVSTVNQHQNEAVVEETSNERVTAQQNRVTEGAEVSEDDLKKDESPKPRVSSDDQTDVTPERKKKPAWKPGDGLKRVADKLRDGIETVKERRSDRKPAQKDDKQSTDATQRSDNTPSDNEDSPSSAN